MSSQLNPKTKEMEFNGIPGVLGCSFGLPLLLYLVSFTPIGAASPLLDAPSLYGYVGWIGVLIALERILPGSLYKGNLLRDGKTRLEYKLNGAQTTGVVVGYLLARIMYCVHYSYPVTELVFITEHYVQLLTASTLVSYVLATGCYLWSFRSDKVMLAEGGNTGNALYDWFIGRELNPRVGPFDIKVFSELRPGLLLWLVFDIAFAYKQYLLFGGMSDSMVLVLMFQLFYIIESIYYEAKSLYMMDVLHDGFGFMLSFGDLTWVPFLYSIQTRYLATHPVHLGVVSSVVLVGMNFTGWYIFRTSNTEKDAFRNHDPKYANMKSIQTKRGTKLLCDGWWGNARHINYFGDWLMSLAWTLTCGFGSFTPYIYVLYFATLLIHRETRDEAHCREKYGDDWTRYKQIAKYRIIPYVY